MAKIAKPPGQQLVKRMSTRTKWLILAPLSLLLIGAGLCVLSEASNAKHTGAPFRQWFLWGTYALILVNGGLSLFGQAVRYRVQLDYRRFVRRELKKRERDWSRMLQKRKSSPGRGED
ncbi:hypothetical protein HNV11_10955 [Spirosoma taeanense]|uniref:Uncharacterized protein n=1 Tax=Spirosoma taeanense TaxID=2735870 RepID=A0A6M5Y5Z2_9BACT|nr:hypothetical protein [Spirosoma taeanense]QJW89857.1 hypothetical protein HNV11_10955 [Spirosoma taeanense]